MLSYEKLKKQIFQPGIVLHGKLIAPRIEALTLHKSAADILLLPGEISNLVQHSILPTK